MRDFVIITVMVLLLGASGWCLYKQVSPPRKEKSNSPVQTYGHPWSPTQTLRDKLPKPPQSYLWEIKVSLDPSGHYIMTLGLFDVLKNTVEDSKSVDLTVRDYNRSWSEFYDEYSSIAHDYFLKDLISPLTAWAKKQVIKKLPSGNVEYHLEG